MIRTLLAAMALAATGLSAPNAAAFCGFYVAKADTSLFNDASRVAIARDGDRTVVTMASDYRGEPKEFAMVIPVPTVLEEGQINVASPGLIDHLDDYTAPRLVEYRDPDPCEEQRIYVTGTRANRAPLPAPMLESMTMDQSLGVTIEAEYEVGEYDILILSAEESSGLIRWLNLNGYKIPDGAEETVGAYLRRGMKFFVAKVNLERHADEGKTELRPIQVAYEDEDFMLPIRLGTVNADGKQELFVFALSRKGRVETTNYRTVKLPSNMDVPIFVEDAFGEFYRDMFRHQVEKENGKAVFLEYAWDMNWCDPCAADPLSPEQLRELGVMWLEERGGDVPTPMPRPGGRGAPPQAVDVFVTRLHLRYDAQTFPEDLTFQATGDRENYQGRYVLRHPWLGDFNKCEAAGEYREGLVRRWEADAKELANLTGWELDDIKARMADMGHDIDALAKAANVKPNAKGSWWDRLWGR